MNVGDHAILQRGKIYYHIVIEEIDNKQSISVRWFGYDRLFDVHSGELNEFRIEFLLTHPVMYSKMSRKFVARVLKSVEYQTNGKTLVYFKGETIPASVFRKLSQEERDTMPLQGEIDYSALSPDQAVNIFFIKPTTLPYSRTTMGQSSFSYENIRRETWTTMVHPGDSVARSNQIMGNGTALDLDCNNKTSVILPLEVSHVLIKRTAKLNKLEYYNIDPECSGAELMPTDLLRRLIFSEYMCQKKRVLKLPARHSILSILDLFRTDPLDNPAIEPSKLFLRDLFESMVLKQFAAMYTNGSLFYEHEELLLYFCMDTQVLEQCQLSRNTSVLTIFGADHLLRVLIQFPDRLKEMNTDINYLLSRFLLLLDYLAEHQYFFAEASDYCDPQHYGEHELKTKVKN
ncbi:Hypothetical protein GLP15_675 [Giardia lamblia P15]|uniref:MRG domain-containing protein n=1 Tax=Giardia intestinalis (strain P15) TaxID=658858 RepID=E1F5D8_GIAIA|nr:Hypothetical protein GLP15_675 [Giardia lamblia P15]